jgi:hypothetical protein
LRRTGTEAGGPPARAQLWTKIRIGSLLNKTGGFSSNRLGLQILHQEAHFRDRSMLLIP